MGVEALAPPPAYLKRPFTPITTTTGSARWSDTRGGWRTKRLANGGRDRERKEEARGVQVILT